MAVFIVLKCEAIVTRNEHGTCPPESRNGSDQPRGVRLSNRV